MRGYVALTDFEWFNFLRSQEGSGEVNFWQPRGGTLLNPPEGMPFFFKLDAAHGSQIVGFGYFVWRSRLPAWLAWDTYEQANGASTREEFLRILARRRGEPTDPTGSFLVSPRLKADYKNGRAYYELEKTVSKSGLHLPTNERLRPNRDSLAWHFEKKFIA